MSNNNNDEEEEETFDIQTMIFGHTRELDDVFQDVTPRLQDDGPQPVCTIDYSPDFIKAYNYMRALLHTKETNTERALKLSGLCVKLNPANYTIWHFRRQCLQSQIDAASSTTTSILQKDLMLAARLGGDNPKNYQIWYHRRALLEIMIQSDKEHSTECCFFATMFYEKERTYIANVLRIDSKNYHAWSHRQWVVLQMANLTENEEQVVWRRELEYAHELIQKDPKNNSAWNYRWFVCHHGGTCRKTPYVVGLDEAQKEAAYAIQGAKLDPYNESPWRYLIGIVKEQLTLDNNDSSHELLEDYLQKTSQVPNEVDVANNYCPNLWSAYIDLLEFKGDQDSLQTAMEHAQNLATKYDPIRKKYWNLRIEEMKSRMIEEQ